jgi:hypothetical protein
VPSVRTNVPRVAEHWRVFERGRSAETTRLTVRVRARNLRDGIHELFMGIPRPFTSRSRPHSMMTAWLISLQFWAWSRSRWSCSG